MKKGKFLLFVLLTMNCGNAEAVYNLEGVNVFANRAVDGFGNVITEQSYLRTGGDVNVITSQEIERKHFQNITEAVRRIPGVHISDMGYRGGEYDGEAYCQTVTINGDPHVVVLIDGRRLDNQASNPAGGQSSSSGNGSIVPLRLIGSIKNVEAIEVIKGPGSSSYGGDASGGIINIITKKGGDRSSLDLDVAIGSWGKHNIGLAYSGSSKDNKIAYYATFNREKSDDLHYKDGDMHKNYTFYGSKYKDNSASFRIDYNISENQFLNFTFNYTNNYDGYPIAARDYKNVERFFSGQVNKDAAVGKKHGPINPGFRNKWWYHGILGNHSTSIARNFNITYQFMKDGDLPSYIRVFKTENDYSDAWIKNWKYPKYTPSLNVTPEQIKSWVDTYEGDFVASHYKDQSKGVELQVGRNIGVHGIIGGVTVSKDSYFNIKASQKGTARINRNSLSGYISDRIKCGENLEITPSLRYVHMDEYSKITGAGEEKAPKNTGVNHLSGMLAWQYKFDNTMNLYGSWAQIFRPKRIDDYDAVKEKLDDEYGDVYNIGIKKIVGKETALFLNYSYLNMANAIGSYSIEDKTSPTGSKNFALNATKKKQSFNIGITHQITENLGIDFSYSYVKNDYRAKNFTLVPDGSGTTFDALWSKQIPTNIYQIDLSYNKDKVGFDFLTSVYSGNDIKFYTSDKFIVSDLSVNYKVNNQITAYLVVNNLWNTAWENRFFYHLGKGAFPQPGRSFLVGMNMKY